MLSAISRKSRFGLEGLIQTDVQHIRDELGDDVHFPQGDVQGPAHVPEHELGLELSEGDDLGHILPAAVALHHVLEDLFPAVDAEVHVDIGHADSARVQEPLEDEVMLDGIQLRDLEAVGDQAPGGGSTAGADGHPVPLPVPDEVGHDEKIAGKPHLLDDGNLIVEALPVEGLVRIRILGPDLLKHLLEPVPGLFFKQGAMRQTGIGLELGKVIGLEIEFHMAAVGDGLGVGNGLGTVGKGLGHLLGGFEIELIGPEFEAVLVKDGLSGLDAEKHLMGPDIALIEIMAVVGGGQGNGEAPAHVQQAPGSPPSAPECRSAGAPDKSDLPRKGPGTTMLPHRPGPDVPSG